MPFQAITLLFLMITLFSQHQTIAQECNQLATCSQCLSRNATCGWCNDMSVFTRLVNSTTRHLQPLSLCGTPDELKAINCPSISIIDPQGSITDDSNDLFNQGMVDDLEQAVPVIPLHANVQVRPGITRDFKVTVQPPDFISVDMYILMDLSFTMRNDRNNLRDLSDQIIDVMSNLTDQFRIGFGSFIDKPVSPFFDRTNVDHACADLSPDENKAVCEPTYAFKHHLDFTDDPDIFKAEVNNSKLSGSLDNPESTLDAILQIAVCQDEIGWGEIGNARRLILIMTDGDYHIALDGKLAGIRREPERTCRLNRTSGIYDYATQVDYPSSAFLAEILNEQQIIPIFAVEQSIRSVYDQLSEIIRSAFVGQLSENSINLLDLLSTQYRRLSSTIVPVMKGLDHIPEINVKIKPINDCTSGSLVNGTEDTCVNVTFPNTVEYNVSISLSPDYCLRSDAETIHSLVILFIGFGDVRVNITGICTCDCEANRIENSPICDNVGTFECSTCLCPSSRRGADCSCPASTITATGCIPPGSSNISQVCSGRGKCVCSSCECDQLPNSNRYYQGDFCECNPAGCPLGANENGNILPCAGHGTCGCDAQCRCDPGYSGTNCECSDATNTCIAPGTGLLCSGAGQCICGTCVCNDYSIRSGTHCEDCVPCSRSCSRLSSCIRCRIEGQCDPSCQKINITSPFQSETKLLRNCSISNQECEVVYQVDSFALGTEDNILVYLNENQSGYIDWSSGCIYVPIEVWLVPLLIIIIIIITAIAGIILFVGIKCIIDSLEVRAWEKSMKSETWRSGGENPLFVDPNASYTNPKYRPRQVIEATVVTDINIQ